MGDTLINSGEKFGNLVALNIENLNGKTYWLCQCDCGKKVRVASGKLRGGYTKRCEECRKQLLKDSPHRLKHGKSRRSEPYAKEYHIWGTLKGRIKNPNHHKYHSHGGKGLTLDPRWEDFENFLADMGEKPYPGASIERLDNEVGYWPSNCVWANRFQQGNNRHDNRIITANGETQCSAWWARETGLKRKTIEQRINQGWSHEGAVNTLPNTTRRKYNYVTPEGIFTSVADAAKANGISRAGVHNRLKSDKMNEWRKE